MNWLDAVKNCNGRTFRRQSDSTVACRVEKGMVVSVLTRFPIQTEQVINSVTGLQVEVPKEQQRAS